MLRIVEGSHVNLISESEYEPFLEYLNDLLGAGLVIARELTDILDAILRDGGRAETRSDAYRRQGEFRMRCRHQVPQRWPGCATPTSCAALPPDRHSVRNAE